MGIVLAARHRTSIGCQAHKAAEYPLAVPRVNRSSLRLSDPMRFSIILIALALLPMMVIGHGWFFTEKQQPQLQQAALEKLQASGIQAAVADLRYLDLRIAGNAPSPDVLDQANAAVSAITPLRVIANELTVPASLAAEADETTLVIKGWLPDPADTRQLVQLLGKLRPDLALQTKDLKTDSLVRWPEGEKPPLTAESQLLRPILNKLRVSPWLEAVRDSKGLHVRGILPANGSRSAVLSALQDRDDSGLLESLHTQQAAFADSEKLGSFLKSFFSQPSPRRFFIDEENGPTIEAGATRTQEGVWLALLRPVSGGKKVNLNLTLYPSEFHLPGHEPTTPLPKEQLKVLNETLAGHLIHFENNSTALSSEAQAQLAVLTPKLLTAGPVLRLVVGGHVSPDGDAQTARRLAKTRAEAVLSFLVEQGLPTNDVQTIAFDPVPSGTPAAPSQSQSVEILIR